jgi:dTDP-4-amino-4,6-dideoxy-D-glucose ammonia-lyase
VTDLTDEAIRGCALPGADLAAAAEATRRVVGADPAAALSGEDADALVRLAAHYGAHPFTPLEDVRALLDVDRERFAGLLDTFGRVPQLREAVLAGPGGKYWSNTVLSMERKGVIDNVLHRNVVYPHIVALYPGPTCMFRCHFCVRVTGARYAASELDNGNAMFSALIDEMPTENPYVMYISGGLEPLTNPSLGTLVSRAANRGFKLTLYSNSFALTEQTLKRQPGLWDLDAIRTSVYGLTDDEYEATTGKRGFERVKANLLRFQKERAARKSPIRLGMSYIVLPGRARRLLDLLDYIVELDAAAPDRPIEFLNLREDYSGRPDGKLDTGEREELRETLELFHEQAALKAPYLQVDYGYALQGLRGGVDTELIRIRPDQMRPEAHIQAGVQIDLLGDVYLYRESGFPGLKGAKRYIAGKMSPEKRLIDVVREHVETRAGVSAVDGDEYFLDGFDQVLTARMNQVEADVAAGWEKWRGLMR